MLSVLAVLSMLALEASAFWRLPCRQALTIERVDPLTDFGNVGQHVHTVHGGNGFSASASNSDLLASTCTSCQVLQDNSAYWTPVMYFQDSAGEFHIVSQTGGMLAYYFLRGDNVTAFPEGFRMIAGDPRLRSFPYPIKPTSDWVDSDRTEAALRQKAIGFNCLNYAEPANAALGLQALPDNMASNCVDGLRAEVFFPSCWNGKDLDSTNHRDHMRYPDLMSDGNCPDGFGTRLVSLFFETIWNVHAFNGQNGKFVFSTGDPLGYGYHGDFMNAWNVPVLQKAIEQCTSLSGVIDECTVFNLQTEDDMHKCTSPPTVHEDVDGPLEALPGCNAVFSGPGLAPIGGCSGDSSLTSSGGSSIKTSSVIKITSTTKPTPSSAVPSSSAPSSATSASSKPNHSPRPTRSAAANAVYNDNYGSYNVAPSDPVVHVADTEPSSTSEVDPNLVIVTVTEYTTVPGTTITVHATPTPLGKRHAQHRRGHKKN